MAIEIKGLKLQAMTARGHLDRMTKAYAKFNEAAPAHAADVEGMAEQVTEMQSDLEFATNLLGNSPAVSGDGALKTAEMPKEPPKSFAGELTGPKEQNLAVTPPLVRLGPNPSITDPLRTGRPPAQEVALSRDLAAEYAAGLITASQRAALEKREWEAGETPATTFPRDL